MLSSRTNAVVKGRSINRGLAWRHDFPVTNWPFASCTVWGIETTRNRVIQEWQWEWRQESLSKWLLEQNYIRFMFQVMLKEWFSCSIKWNISWLVAILIAVWLIIQKYERCNIQISNSAHCDTHVGYIYHCSKHHCKGSLSHRHKLMRSMAPTDTWTGFSGWWDILRHVSGTCRI